MLILFVTVQAETLLWECPDVIAPVDARPYRTVDGAPLDAAWGEAIAEALVWVDPSCVACETVAEGEPWVDDEWTTGERCTADCAGADGSAFTFLSEVLETEDMWGELSSTSTYELAITAGASAAPWASASLRREDESDGGPYGGGSSTEWWGEWTDRTPDAWAEAPEAHAEWSGWSSDDTTGGGRAAWSDDACTWAAELEALGYYGGDTWDVSVGYSDVRVVETDGVCVASLDAVEVGEVDCATWEATAEPCGCTGGAGGAAAAAIGLLSGLARRRSRRE